ncbi:MAG: MAPEG family protein [Myxococcota bacterium]
MELVVIVVAVALLEYIYLATQVGQARGKYEVPAPAISGHPTFERLYRVQMNTLEQLIIFLPSIWLFATYVSTGIAAALGVVFVVGRFLYFKGYVDDPEKRTTGFLLTFGANVVLLFGALVGAVLTLL